MAGFHRQRARHQLMVNGLINLGFAAVGRQANASHRRVQRHVDFIKGQPQFYFAFEAFKHRAGVAFKEANHLAVAPTAVVFHQRPRHLVVGQRHQRGDVVLRHLIEQLVVKCQPGFIGFSIVAVGVNPRPRNRNTQTVEAHLGKQCDIFRIAVIEIDRHIFNAGITRYTLDNFAKNAVRLYVGGRQSFAIFQISAFDLICRGRAAPKKRMRECFHLSLL